MNLPKVLVRSARIALALVVSASIVTAQKSSDVAKESSTLVTVDARVFGANEAAITNLTKDDFTIYLDGQKQEIRRFESVETPVSILLLVDRSSSMEDDWTFLEPAITRFMASLRPQDRVAIAGFADKPEMLMNWRNARDGQPVDVDVRPNRRQMQVFVGGGASTAPDELGRSQRIPGSEFSYSAKPVEKDFYGALSWAETQMHGIRTRNAVLVYSDGVPPIASMKRGFQFVNSDEDREFQKLLRSTQQSEVPIYFVTVGTDLNPRRSFPINNLIDPMQIRSRLQQLGEASGGSVAYPRNPNEVAPLYEQIARELGMTYSLSFASTGVGAKGNSGKIEVRVRGDNFRVRQSGPRSSSAKTTAE